MKILLRDRQGGSVVSGVEQGGGIFCSATKWPAGSGFTCQKLNCIVGTLRWRHPPWTPVAAEEFWVCH